jgi:hypothetical protein
VTELIETSKTETTPQSLELDAWPELGKIDSRGKQEKGSEEEKSLRQTASHRLRSPPISDDLVA